jgi:type II secretory pathway pseudopilin PulG
MSTGLIVVIVVAAIILLALLVMLPRMRASAQRQKAERELHRRRETVADEQRTAAREREERADVAEQKARMAQQAAEKERAEAGMMKERAQMHEQGRADHELVDESERDRFSDVMSTPADRDGDGHTMDDRARDALHRDDDNGARMESEGGATSPEYEEGRQDERRFERSRITDDVRESERR